MISEKNDVLNILSPATGSAIGTIHKLVLPCCLPRWATGEKNCKFRPGFVQFFGFCDGNFDFASACQVLSRD